MDETDDNFVSSSYLRKAILSNIFSQNQAHFIAFNLFDISFVLWFAGGQRFTYENRNQGNI